MSVQPIPEGYRTVTPYLMVPGVRRLLDFMQAAFGAQVKVVKGRDDGSVMHAEVKVGDSMVMLGEPVGEFGPMPTQIYLYVESCDEVYAQAVGAGGESVMPPTDMPPGERYGGVKDPSGNLWWIATHVEDVTPEEEARRWREFSPPDAG